MKKLFTLVALLLCVIVTKAQRPQLDISNTTGTAMNMSLFANANPIPACGVSGNTHQISIGSSVTPYNVSSGILAFMPTWLNPTVPFPATNLTEMSIFVTVGGNVYSEQVILCGSPSYTTTLTFTGMFTCTMAISTVGPKYVISLY
jgi:hypothetical protein